MIDTCERFPKEGQVPPGSMSPKVENALGFLKSGGKRAVVASLESANDALAGKAGTTITVNSSTLADR